MNDSFQNSSDPNQNRPAPQPTSYPYGQPSQSPAQGPRPQAPQAAPAPMPQVAPGQTPPPAPFPRPQAPQPAAPQQSSYPGNQPAPQPSGYPGSQPAPQQVPQVSPDATTPLNPEAAQTEPGAAPAPAPAKGKKEKKSKNKKQKNQPVYIKGKVKDTSGAFALTFGILAFLSLGINVFASITAIILAGVSKKHHGYKTVFARIGKGLGIVSLLLFLLIAVLCIVGYVWLFMYHGHML